MAGCIGYASGQGSRQALPSLRLWTAAPRSIGPDTVPLQCVGVAHFDRLPMISHQLNDEGVAAIAICPPQHVALVSEWRSRCILS